MQEDYHDDMTPIKPKQKGWWEMGSIHRKGRKDQISIYWEGTRYWIKEDPATGTAFYDQNHARNVLSRIQSEIMTGSFNIKYWLPNSPVKLGEHYKEWIRRKRIAKKTRRGYNQLLRDYVVPILGPDKDIRKITIDDCNEIIFQMEGTRDRDTPLRKTTHDAVATLKNMLRDAHRSGTLTTLPAFPVLNYKLSEITALTMEQQDRILEAIPEEDRAIFICGMELGLRTQEVRAIQKECIDYDRGTITIDRKFAENEFIRSTKTGSKGVRVLPIPDRLREALGNLNRRRLPVLSNFVFTRHDGKPYTNKNLNTIWHRACNLVGVRIKLQNAFRHSLGCQLADAEVDQYTIAEILGHTDTRTTARYAKRSLKTKAAALERRKGKVVEFTPKVSNSTPES